MMKEIAEISAEKRKPYLPSRMLFYNLQRQYGIFTSKISSAQENEEEAERI